MRGTPGQHTAACLQHRDAIPRRAVSGGAGLVLRPGWVGPYQVRLGVGGALGLQRLHCFLQFFVFNVQRQGIRRVPPVTTLLGASVGHRRHFLCTLRPACRWWLWLEFDQMGLSCHLTHLLPLLARRGRREAAGCRWGLMSSFLLCLSAPRDAVVRVPVCSVCLSPGRAQEGQDVRSGSRTPL